MEKQEWEKVGDCRLGGVTEVVWCEPKFDEEDDESAEVWGRDGLWTKKNRCFELEEMI